jgi:toxin ParE1/3/4
VKFPRVGKDYAWIKPNLCGFIVNDYIIFYYPHENGIDIVRVVYEWRDLKALLEESV